MAYKLKTAPAAEPLTLTEAKTHVRVDGTDFDTELTTMITMARKYAESYLNMSLVTQTWYRYLDNIPYDGIIYLMRGPVQSITSIKYYDADNSEQTLSTDYYNTDLVSNPARIEVTDLPTTYDRLNAVVIEFVTGFGGADAVPETVKHAMLIYIAHMFENRGDEGHRTPPKAFYELLNMSRIKVF